MITDSSFQHGIDWTGQDVAGWLGSEKLDGCRCWWDGFRLWTRSGLPIDAPREFIDQLPAGFALDGEVWAGRGQFEVARVAVRHGGRYWTPDIRFMAFDAPGAFGPWTSRLESIRNVWTDTVECFHVLNTTDALVRLREVKGAGGEGIVLREPTIQGYRAGRSGAVLKVK
ncbi:MAG: hypothetical protein ACYDC1_16450 [Limisphaerales bacterium]